jgi:hypothetical protein
MTKTIYIRDYEDDRKAVNIENFEDVIYCRVKISSGDEVLTVIYKDGNEMEFDSSTTRFENYYDDEYKIPLNKLDDFSNFIGSSYSCERMILGDEY